MVNQKKNSNEGNLLNHNVKHSTMHYKVVEISLKKRYGVYIRVSGNSQSENLQKEAAKKWLEANCIPISEVEFFNEHALSANKVVMENRPQLMRLLNAMKSGQVTCVLVFTRCRLARNFFEYSEIVDIFYAADIDVFFTCTETPPFSKDYLIEGIYGIQIQSEGANIKARLQDVHNMNPPAKFGYVKSKDKKYYVDERYHYKIIKAFESTSLVNGYDELLDLILRNKKELNRNGVEDVWKFFRSPFYAGHYQKGPHFYLLEHVQPIIDLDLYKRVQRVLDKFEQNFIDSIITSREQSYVTPTCKECGKKMVHKNTKVGESAYYKCPKHKNICITTKEVSQNLTESITAAISSFREEDLKNVCRRTINKTIKALGEKKKELGNELMTIRRRYALNYDPNNQKNIDQHMDRVKSMLAEIENINSQIVDLTNTQSLVNDLINVVKSRLIQEMSKEKIHLFVNFMIKKVTVSFDVIELEVYLAEFTGVKKLA
ncbi:recombinase family protein [Sutcliffiella horikoshii]|uniref:recombinase family protein n=1 Tax=Sutcliffiella horikoshii TaxID=79883 RepID=UPI003CF28D39